MATKPLVITTYAPERYQGDFDESTGLYRSTGTATPPHTMRPVGLEPVYTIQQTTQTQPQSTNSFLPLLLIGLVIFLLKD